MKVLISGGAKTANIANALQKKLASSGMDFMVVPFIEDIQDIFVRGEYFDRAILIEQGWTHDNTISDEYQIRNTINYFANSMAEVGGSNTTYVFLSQTDEMASLVSEEIASIYSQSALIVKKPTYYVNFFEKLATFELNQMPREYLYNPNQNVGIADEPQDIPVEETGVYVDKFEQDNGVGNANRMDIDTGDDFNIPSENAPFSDPEFDDSWPEEQNNQDGWQSQPDNWPEENPNPANDWNGDNQNWDNQDQNLEGQEPNQNWDNQEQNWDNQDQNWDNQGQEPNQNWDNQDQNWDNQDQNWDNQEQNWDNQDQNSEYPTRESGTIPDYSGPDPGFNPGTWDNQDYSTPQVDPMPQDIPTQETGFNSDDYDQTNQNNQNDFSPDMYKDDDDTSQDDASSTKKVINRPKLNNKQIKSSFDAFAARGNSIVVTGCGGSGNSTIAFNLANTLCNLGYTVLLVDMDTVNKAQSYISKDNYDAVYSESASVMTAINSSSGINAYVSVVRQGFHLLTMGMGSDSIKPDKAFSKEKLNRFVQLAKTSHNFVIYDIPFEYAVGHLDTITYSADNIVLSIDSSNWGIAKTLLNICNIGSDDMEELLFSRAQLLFNRYRGINKLFGRKVKKIKDITNVMDKQVKELVGEDIGYYFSDMHVCGTIKDDPSFESGWFDDIQYSDTKKGFELFTDILMRIVLHT